MAPRKKNAAIKSSGATSSKAAPLPDWVKGGGKPPPPSAAAASSSRDDGRPPPLFPPGTKTPQNLLNERLQKLHKDWNRPDYHPKPLGASATPSATSSDSEHGNGQQQQQPAGVEWTCSVNLTRPNPRDKSTNDVVRMTPDDSDERQSFTPGEVMSKEMARHWGATYALFRLFSTQSLGLMLPKQFKNYWSSLESWKKSLPAEKQALLFAADPFAAQAQVKAEREAKAAKREREEQRKKDARDTSSGVKLPKRWREAKEARMSKSMRDWVEEVVKRASAALPTIEEGEDGEIEGEEQVASTSKAPAPIDEATLTRQLTTLNFRPGYIASAISWLPRARKALATTQSAARRGDYLLQTIATQSDLDACLTYLTLYVPEEDLPSRFKAGFSSESFVTTAIGKGKEDGLKLQYALDRLTMKGAGYPKAAAEKELSVGTEVDMGEREVATMRRLAGRLRGQAASSPSTPSVPASPSISLAPLSLTDDERKDLCARRKEEVEVIEAILGADRLLPLDPNDRPLGFEGRDDAFDIIVAGPSRANLEGGGSKGGDEWGKEEIRLRILWKHDRYPAEPTPPTFYVVSPGVAGLPPYLRLALTQHLLRKLDTSQEWKQMLQEGQIVLAMVEELDASWKAIVRGDKIKFEEVMAGFTTQPSRSDDSPSQPPSPSKSIASSSKAPEPSRPRPPHQNRNAAIMRDFAADQKLLQRAAAFRSSPQGSKLLSARETLPIAHHYADIVATLADHRLTLLTGSTGSGKTTQLPQFILDSEIAASRGSTCRIIVTQPRRVSAMSIAERVAHERGEHIGDTVGWQVRGDRRIGYNNRILFTTTGLLLRRLQSEPDLASISHLLIDEIHERSLDSDLLLLEVSALLRANPRIKVVLMSATLQKEKYVAYFANRIPASITASVNAPTSIGSIDVEGRTFPVEDFYLEDLVQATSFRPSSNSPASWAASRDKAAGPLKGLRVDMFNRGLSEGDITAMEILERSGPGLTPMDYELVGRAVRHVVQRECRKEAIAASSQGQGKVELGAILVFMSGVGEIRQAIDAIRQSCTNPPVEVLPLHSNLANSDQQLVFQPTKSGLRKVVVATNVAEASITIDGVTAVVDSGRVKETAYDPEAGLTRLVEKMTSKASATQRRGRAGRTRPGECWKLFSRTMEARVMPANGEPEMTRVPLENVVLYALTMGKEDPEAYLRQAVDPPSLKSISSAIANLHEAGAVRSTSGKGLTTTALGRHLASLPLDLRLGKLLILGALFQCLSPLLTIAALMSTTKPLYAASFEERDAVAAMRTREAQARGTRSDLLTDASLYDEYAAFTSRPAANSAVRNRVAKQFVTDHWLSPSTLRDVAAARGDLLRDLQGIGFAPADYKSYTGHELDQHAGEMSVLRALVCAALWPVVVRVASPETKFAESSSGAIAKDAEAKQIRLFDDPIGSSSSATTSTSNGRVFLHPGSVLFSATKMDASHLAVWRKSDSGKSGAKDGGGKVFLRDATEVPVYALLLFCGKLKIHHIQGGISILPRAAAAPPANAAEEAPGPSAATDANKARPPTTAATSSSANGNSSGSSSRANSRPSTPAAAAPSHPSPAHEEEGSIRLRAPARIAVLSAQLRRLLDAFLAEAWEQGPTTTHFAHQQHQLPPPPHQQQQGHGRRGSQSQGQQQQREGKGWGEGKRVEDMKRELMDVLRALLERDGMGRDAI